MADAIDAGRTYQRNCRMEAALILVVWSIIFILGLIVHKPGLLIGTRVALAMWLVFALLDSFLVYFEPSVEDKGIGRVTAIMGQFLVQGSVMGILLLLYFGLHLDGMIAVFLYLAIRVDLTIFFDRRVKARRAWLQRKIDHAFKLNGRETVPQGERENFFAYAERIANHPFWDSFDEKDREEAQDIRDTLRRLCVE